MNTPVPELAELAVVERSGFVESRHYGSVAVVDAAGAIRLQLGSPDATILPRSSVKPVQALTCLKTLARSGENVTTARSGENVTTATLVGAELALAAASHTGEDKHVRLVRALLERAGLTEESLGCPPDRPSDEATFVRLAAAGEPRARVRMNCSGKHAAMLLACSSAGWPTDSYLSLDHPLQRAVAEELAAATGEPVRHTAVDGCGAPLYSTSVTGLARLFSAFVTAEPGSPRRLVADAMRAHPFYVAGTGHVNTRVMQLVPGLLAKGGAEGVIGMATAEGLGVAVKVIDGSPRTTTLIALTALAACGADVSAADELTHIAVLGGGKPVGEIRPGAAFA